MNKKNLSSDSDFLSGHLDRILSFFFRVDSKASALFAINSTLLGVMFVRFDFSQIVYWQIAIPTILATLLLSTSMIFLYVCGFPHLQGGHNSLIYFYEISKRTESGFVQEILSAASDDLNKDIAQQIWRNSEILSIKFLFLKRAFICTSFSLLPWCVFLSISSWSLSS